MAPLVSLIIIISLSFLITRIATELLVHTGLSREAARFQSRSAFTGVGFTTQEAENIVNHPARRRIIMTLMLIGNIGIISAIASLMLTFIDSADGNKSSLLRIGVIVIFMGMVWVLSKSKWMENALISFIKKILKRFTDLNVRDYVELLDLTGEYEITVIKVNKGDWMENQQAGELGLKKEGINLIGIQRKDGSYLGTPQDNTTIRTYDHLILYGRESNLKNLENRKRDTKGKKEHEKAVEKQNEEFEKQQKKDRTNDEDEFK
ncbi:MAG: TrkA C-terminal domain-containing protein [Bacteroidota bacterium]